ncbi:hypothetical protein [Variovorax ginsengisoli]|uniref:Cytochrome c553 n=1 Tax=Variovorax ginsengisoli TaxID=363844 RepID=A0ABT9SHA1_9BURK|nr:hypothetical protein [Variovorax ginsengisoli]MDP9902792.1 cytochrome c553 [Variovorax ginsengisoli]
MSADHSRPHATLPAMTRWLLLVLLFALPAQFVWAATAGYCAHESSPTSFHLGHHSHAHRVSTPDKAHASTPQQDPPDSAISAHGDCSYCHGVVVQLPAHTAPAGMPPAPRAFASAPTAFLDVGLQASIERPKWTRAR